MTASNHLIAALLLSCAWLYLVRLASSSRCRSTQGGDVAYRSVRTQIPIARAYLEPQGLQDADFDLLTSNMSTMSSTYQTILSGAVTVGEAGDAVTVHVTGQIGWMGAALYVVDTRAMIMADRRPDGSGVGSPGRQLSFRPYEPDRHHVARRVALRSGQRGAMSYGG